MPIIRKTSIELPKDNTKVRFRFGFTRPWLYGTYIESESMFYINKENFFYAHDLCDWQYVPLVEPKVSKTDIPSNKSFSEWIHSRFSSVV